LYGLRDIELRIAATKSNWQWQAKNSWSSAQTLLDPLPTFLNDIAGEMNPEASGYNIIIDSEHAFNNLRKAKKRLTLARASIEQAKTLDPRLNAVADAGLAEVTNLENNASQKLEQICGIYLSPHPPGARPLRPGIYFHFDSIYGAYNWCSGHPNNRWALLDGID
jgi:hypothetical protein